MRVHQQRCHKALDAIHRLHSDRSVPMAQRLESLTTLASEIEDLIGIVQDEVAGQASGS